MTFKFLPAAQGVIAQVATDLAWMLQAATREKGGVRVSLTCCEAGISPPPFSRLFICSP
jgi:hypothetical protein